MKLNGSVAIITGAGGGIGSALARRLASEGMTLVLSDRDSDGLDRIAAEVSQVTDLSVVVGDVATESHHSVLTATARDLGELRLSVLNAGVYLPGLVWEIPVAEWRLQMEVNFWGVLYGVRAAVPAMIESGIGHVVAVASGAGLVATPALGPYVASKHAVVGLMESLRHELNRVAPHVHASVVCPGNVRSPMAANSLAAAGIEHEHLSPVVAELADQVRAGNAAGADPTSVADAVVEAVGENRFWVLPQPEVAWGAVDRMERLRDGREPVDFLT